MLLSIATTLCAAESVPSPLPLGSPAVAFSLPGVDGHTYTLDSFKDAKALLIVFTCNHCPTAQYYEQRICQIVADYRDKGLATVAISPNDPKSVRLDELGWTDLGDTFEEMKIRARDHKFNFPYLYDGDSETTSRAYGPAATPHAFLFDSRRVLRYVGAIDDSERVQHAKTHYLRDAIDAVLAGRKPVVEKTKVVGCSVKWSGKAEGVAAYLEKLAAEPVSLSPVGEKDLADLRKNASGKFRLVTFWATWCAPCVAEFDEFVTINRMYRHRDFELVAVSMNRPEEHERALDFLKKKQASFKNLAFESANRDKLINSFDPEWEGGVPHTVLISPAGEVIYQQEGSLDPLAMKRAILRSMNELKPW
jgi:peroxiredoxin